ncbi:hypothetical protein ACHAPT_007946 [Fusarium lateritium]
MKSSVAYNLLFLLGAVRASAECVEGHRETISPGYVVEYKCNVYRQGELHNNIATEKECAILCRDAGRSTCTHHAPSKRCIVGDENGKDVPRPGAVYMVKVEDDDEDPFKMDCDKEKKACLERETSLTAQLSQCQADASSAGLKCAVSGWGSTTYYERINGMALAQCKQKCLADSRCLSYSDDMWGPGGNCYLYEKAVKDVPTVSYPKWGMYDRACA